MDGKLFQEVSSWRSVPAETHTGLPGVSRGCSHPQAARSPALPGSAQPPASPGTQVPPVPGARRLPRGSSPPRGGQDSPAGPLGEQPGAPRPPALRANPVARREGHSLSRLQTTHFPRPGIGFPGVRDPESTTPTPECLGGLAPRLSVCVGGWGVRGGNRSFSGSSQSLMLDTTASARSPGPNHCRYLMQGQIQKKTRALESILGGPHALSFTEFRRKELEKPDKKVFQSGTTESIFVSYSVGVFRGAVDFQFTRLFYYSFCL